MAVGALFRSTSSLVAARLFATSAKRAPLQERKLVDRFRLSVRGGPGGSGCTSFRKSRHSRHGIADGEFTGPWTINGISLSSLRHALRT